MVKLAAHKLNVHLRDNVWFKNEKWLWTSHPCILQINSDNEQFFYYCPKKMILPLIFIIHKWKKKKVWMIAMRRKKRQKIIKKGRDGYNKNKILFIDMNGWRLHVLTWTLWEGYWTKPFISKLVHLPFDRLKIESSRLVRHNLMFLLELKLTITNL